MNKTTMLGLTEPVLQAVINQYDLKPYYYPTLFPLKETQTLTWKTLEMMSGLKVAADLVARGARLDAKTREALSVISGEIPKIAIKRTMDENALNDYDIMIAMSSGNPSVAQLVNAWKNDADYCWQGVAARLEWMALQTISQGETILTNANNNSVITNLNLSFPVPTSQKTGYITGSSAWTAPTTAKPISKDFRGIQDLAVAAGKTVKFAFMNMKTFADFTQTDEVVKMCQPYQATANGVSFVPDIMIVNTVLAKLPYLRGLQIIVIDQEVTIEAGDGTRTTANPFHDNVVMYSDRQVLGTTHWKTPADMKLQGSAAIKVMNMHTCIKKYSTEEPIEEITMGIANAVCSWDNYSSCYLQDVKNSTWQKGA